MGNSDDKTTVSADLLFRWIRETGASQADFGRVIGESDQNINNWKRRGIPKRQLAKVAGAMGLTYEEYERNAGDARKPELRFARSGEPSTEKIQLAKRSIIPLVSRVQGGNKNPAIDPFPPGAPEEWVETTVTVSKDAFALRVRGDSMAPDFPEGSIIIIDPTIEPRNGDYVVVRFNNSDEATFKRLVIDGPLKLLVPINQSYRSIEFTEDAQMVGKVVQHQQIRSL